MKYYLSPKKLDSKEDAVKEVSVPSLLFDLSPNLIHTYGKCRQRWQLAERMRFSSLNVLSDHFRKVIEQSDDCPATDDKSFAKYLDLISTEELKDKPLSRLQSRHPLRRISRVALRPKPTDKVDIKTMDLTSHLRRICLKGVESLNQSDIELKIRETELFCKTTRSESNYSFGYNLSQTPTQTQNERKSCEKSLSMSHKSNDLEINSSDKLIDDRICRLVLHKLKVCPNCEDPLFNRSRKNTKRKRYHSCLKGIVNHHLSEGLENAFN